METFSRSWRGWVHSSDGYDVRLLGRTNLQYRDQAGVLQMSAEAMSDPWTNVVVEVSSIPDTVYRPRRDVIDRLRRAFAFNGWTLIEHDSTPGVGRP